MNLLRYLAKDTHAHASTKTTHMHADMHASTPPTLAHSRSSTHYYTREKDSKTRTGGRAGRGALGACFFATAGDDPLTPASTCLYVKIFQEKKH